MNIDRPRCWLCFMRSAPRWMGIPICAICRDQLYDFAWVSVVQAIVWLLGGIDGWFFVIDEVLLFLVLVVVKHRIPSPWEHRG
ncbi:MAG: hypothetical protein ACE5OQ_08520 [Woeseia sp.]